MASTPAAALLAPFIAADHHVVLGNESKLPVDPGDLAVLGAIVPRDQDPGPERTTLLAPGLKLPPGHTSRAILYAKDLRNLMCGYPTMRDHVRRSVARWPMLVRELTLPWNIEDDQDLSTLPLWVGNRHLWFWLDLSVDMGGILKQWCMLNAIYRTCRYGKIHIVSVYEPMRETLRVDLRSLFQPTNNALGQLVAFTQLSPNLLPPPVAAVTTVVTTHVPVPRFPIHPDATLVFTSREARDVLSWWDGSCLIFDEVDEFPRLHPVVAEPSAKCWQTLVWWYGAQEIVNVEAAAGFCKRLRALATEHAEASEQIVLQLAIVHARLPSDYTWDQLMELLTVEHLYVSNSVPITVTNSDRVTLVDVSSSLLSQELEFMAPMAVNGGRLVYNTGLDVYTSELIVTNTLDSWLQRSIQVSLGKLRSVRLRDRLQQALDQELPNVKESAEKTQKLRADVERANHVILQSHLPKVTVLHVIDGQQQQQQLPEEHGLVRARAEAVQQIYQLYTHWLQWPMEITRENMYIIVGAGLSQRTVYLVFLVVDAHQPRRLPKVASVHFEVSEEQGTADLREQEVLARVQDNLGLAIHLGFLSE